MKFRRVLGRKKKKFQYRITFFSRQIYGHVAPIRNCAHVMNDFLLLYTRLYKINVWFKFFGSKLDFYIVRGNLG